MSLRTQRNSLPLMCFNFKKSLLVEDWYEFWRDDFDDGIIEPEWLIEKTNPPDKTIVESGGDVMISVAWGINGRWAWGDILSPRLRQELEATPPLRITTKIKDFTVDDGTFAGLFIGQEVDAYIGCTDCYLWGRYRNGLHGNGVAVLNNCIGLNAYLWGLPALPKWFRIEIDASEDITFYHSPDGSTWHQVESAPGVPYILSGYYTDDLKIGIFAGSNFRAGFAPLVEAPFEYFLIEVYEARHPTFERCYAPIDARASETFYDGRIKRMSSLKRAIDDKTGLFQITDMNVTLANADKEFSRLMASNILKNQEVVLYHHWTEESETLKSHIITMIVEDHSMKGPDFDIKLKDITQKYFTKNIPERICIKGSGEGQFPNLHPDHEGRHMPEVLGHATLPETFEHPGAVEAVYVDILGAGTRDYLAARGWLRSAIDNANFEVYEEGIAGPRLAATMTNHTDGHSYINYSPVDADAAVSFNCYGYSIPVWDSGNNCVQNLAYIIQYFLRYIMGIPASLIDAPSFATLAAYYISEGVDENFYLIIQDQQEGMEILRQLLFTGGAKGFMAKSGKFEVARKNLCNWQIPRLDSHIFEQIELFGSPHRQWNLTSAVNTIESKYGYIPWQRLFVGAKEEYRDNRYDVPMYGGHRMLPMPDRPE